MITLLVISSIIALLLLSAGGFMLITDVGPQMPLENLRWQTKDIDGQSAYVAATGHVLNASDFGLSVIQQVILSQPVATATGARTLFILGYLTPGKGGAQQGSTVLTIIFRNLSDALATGNGDLSAQTFRVTAIGY